MHLSLLLPVLLLSLPSHSDSHILSRTKRKSSLTEIISSYFAGPVIRPRKPRTRLHLPRQAVDRRILSAGGPPPPLVRPPRLGLPPRSQASVTAVPRPQSGGARLVNIPAPLLVGGRRKEAGHTVPAPLLARNVVVPRSEGGAEKEVQRNTFSQLISKTQKSDPAPGPEPQSDNEIGFVPRSELVTTERSQAGRAHQEEGSRVVFRNEEEVRYQNDYFKLPEREDFYEGNHLNNGFPQFEVPKIDQREVTRYDDTPNYMNPLDKFHDHSEVETFSASERTPAVMHTSERLMYSPQPRTRKPFPPQSNISRHPYKPPKPLLHRSPGQTENFPQDNSGFFEIPRLGPGFPSSAAAPRVSHQSPPPYRAKGRTNPLPNFHSPQSRASPVNTHSPRSQPTSSFKAKWETPRPIQRSSPPATPPPPPPPPPPTHEPTSVAKQAWGSNSGPQSAEYAQYDTYSDYYQEEHEYDYYYNEPPSKSFPEPTQSQTTPDSSQSGRFLEPAQTRNFPDPPQSRTFQDPPQSRTFQDPPQSRTFQSPPQPRRLQDPPHPSSVMPPPLDPPAGLLEMQHDSVFSGPWDVPKLGTNTEYKPPEMFYNEMYNQPSAGKRADRFISNVFNNRFNSPAPSPSPSRSRHYSPPALQFATTPSPRPPTSVPFLPTPSKPFKSNNNKPFSEYGSLYDSPYKPVNKKKPDYQKRRYESLPPYTPPAQSLPHYVPPVHTSRPYVPPNPQVTFEDPPADFFLPVSSPSITFEPRPEDQNPYNEKTLHNIVKNQLDYEDGNQKPEMFLPFIEDDVQNLSGHSPSSQLRNTLYHDYDPEPRYRRYQSVDYSSQDATDYNYDQYEPQRFDSDLFPHSPTPQPLDYDNNLASFLPPPTDFSSGHRSPSPEYHSPDIRPAEYYSSDHKGADYYSPDYNTLDHTTEKYISEYPSHTYRSPEYDGPEYHSPEYNSPEYDGPEYRSPEYHSPEYRSLEYDGSEYHSPQYLKDLDAVSPDFHISSQNVWAQDLGSQDESLWGNKVDVTESANQFVNAAGPDKFEHGHVRGNPEHKKQEYTRREGRHFKSQVTWADGDDGYGKHYFEYNH